MELRPYILYIIATAIVWLGFYILFRDRKNLVNRSFAITAFGVVAWIGANATIFFINDHQVAEFVLKITYAGGAILTGGFLLFAWAFPYKISIITLAKWLVVIIPTCFFIITSLFTDWIVDGVVKYSFYIDITAGPLYLLYLLYFFTFFGWAFVELVRKYRRANGMHVRQIKYVLISATIPFIIGAIFDLIIPWLGIERSAWTSYGGSLSSAVWLGLTAYILFRK